MFFSGSVKKKINEIESAYNLKCKYVIRVDFKNLSFCEYQPEKCLQKFTSFEHQKQRRTNN